MKRASEKGTRRTRRTRRTPDEARAVILDAADRVFAKHLPDAVGLKEVAREAGVSHALVTHYFSTYFGLVEAALERRFARLRTSLMTQLLGEMDASASATALLATYRKAIAAEAADPVTIRLGTWAMMSGLAAKADFFSHRIQGLKLFADALEHRADVPREDLEFCLVASFAMAVVWTVGGPALAGALGNKSAKDRDPFFEERATRMIDAYLQQARR